MNHQHETHAAYLALVACGMPEMPMRIGTQINVKGCTIAVKRSTLGPSYARDLLTMHALRWLIEDSDGGVDVHFFDDGAMLELDGRKKHIGDVREDLLDAIVEAALAMKGASSAS